ncbi:MAG: hypothetical protein ACM3Q2_06900, partial [Syntrophothermus sp.]
IPFANNIYAATFDFDGDMLKKLFIIDSNRDYQRESKKELLKAFDGYMRLDISEHPVTVNIYAHIGRPVNGKYEEFIPLVVKKFQRVKVPKLKSGQNTVPAKSTRAPQLFSGSRPAELFIKPANQGTGIFDRYGRVISYPDLNLPPDITYEFARWIEYYCENINCPQEFEFGSFSEKGLELARMLKLYLRNLARIYYDEQEIFVNEAVEV